MKQPDTAALRERLANYTLGQEREHDVQELDELLQEVNCQIVELRNLLKSINALKEELHDIHGSLKHTAQRERSAFNALLAAKDSADNIVDGIYRAIIKVEQNTVIHAKVGTEELKKVNQCTAEHIQAQEAILEKHRERLAGHLRKNEGVWLSSRWLIFVVVSQIICYLAVILWAIFK
jgi:cell division septum initiation protein DivIVA